MAEIDGYNDTIDKSDVESRIEELQDQRGYDVIRVRNDEVIKNFDDENEAQQYIEDEDYNPERVVIRQGQLDEDDEQELRDLETLIGDVSYGGDWTLYNADYFSEDWAKDQAADALGTYRSRVDFDSWPLDQIDWESAAAEQRDRLYPYAYEFDGTTFYGDE